MLWGPRPRHINEPSANSFIGQQSGTLDAGQGVAALAATAYPDLPAAAWSRAKLTHTLESEHWGISSPRWPALSVKPTTMARR